MEKQRFLNSTVIIFSDEALDGELQKDIGLLGFQREKTPGVAENFLELRDNVLTLYLKSGLKIQIDFSQKKYHRIFSPRTDLLCRACGWHLGYRSVWDLTSGLAVDSFLLARAGFNVLGFERNKNLALLLRHAVRTYKLPPQDSISSIRKDKIQHLEFIWADSEEFLAQSHSYESFPQPDVLYYDPMYPAKNKTALPSKEVQALREMNGSHEESVSLLMKALSLKVKRVVVKRPVKAPPLLEKPKFQIKGKLVRFDVY